MTLSPSRIFSMEFFTRSSTSTSRHPFAKAITASEANSGDREDWEQFQNKSHTRLSSRRSDFRLRNERQSTTLVVKLG